MTLQKLQDIVRVLANCAYTRYWIHWSPFTDCEGKIGSLMAVQCLDDDGNPKEIADAESHGFTYHFNSIYTVPRTEQDGSTYISRI